MRIPARGLAALSACAISFAAAAAEPAAVAVGRVRYAFPTGVSASVAEIRYRLPDGWPCVDVCRYQGVMTRLEIGLEGARIDVGWARAYGRVRPGRAWMREAYLGYAVSGTFVRTFSDAPGDVAERTWVGAEASFTITRVNFTFGAMYRVAGEPLGDRYRLTGGLGWGF